jgi:hypothetical protein
MARPVTKGQSVCMIPPKVSYIIDVMQSPPVVVFCLNVPMARALR